MTHARTVFLTVGVLLGAGCAALAPAPSDAPRDVLIFLAPTIRADGEATVVVDAPGAAADSGAVPQTQRLLAWVLQLPYDELAHDPPPRCPWSPPDLRGGPGVWITVSALDVRGDSAFVDVHRTCRATTSGKESRYEADRTWVLRRVEGRWRVERTSGRVT